MSGIFRLLFAGTFSMGTEEHLSLPKHLFKLFPNWASSGVERLGCALCRLWGLCLFPWNNGMKVVEGIGTLWDKTVRTREPLGMQRVF